MQVSFFSDLLETISERGRRLVARRSSAAPSGPNDLADLASALLSRHGEASGVGLASLLLESYRAADDQTRLRFLSTLAKEFGPDSARVQGLLAAALDKPDDERIGALHAASEPRRQELFRRLNLAPGGTAGLVRMREDLLGHLPSHPILKAVDRDFTHLFASWFNRGFLVLRPINWSTPAIVLEKIIRYEAVHAITDWDDLRRRLDPPDRRCFAFFHPALADDPLIFVEVALTREIPAAVAPLLAASRPPLSQGEATTAVFYSISNCQRGLAGVSFGNFLIKQVVEDLRRALPNLTTFVTLSPVPGFADWVERERYDDGPLSTAEERAALARLGTADASVREALRPVLLAASARYLTQAKTPGGKPLDPVARFHLGNGARLERVNLEADLSERGLRQAHGVMVNYLYDLEAIEENHEAFAERGDVAISSAVRRLLPAPALPRKGRTQELVHAAR